MLRVPRTLLGRDIKALPLSPAEAYLLSRVDGVVNERELSLITGIAHTDVTVALDRLRHLGAIEFVGEPAASRGRAQATPPPPPVEQGRSVATFTAQPSASPAAHAVHPSSAPRALSSAPPPPQGDARPLYDPAELDEDVEIDREKRRRILDVFYRLDELTHYGLLAVSDDADKKQIKSAYYQLAPEFHPDKYFRKRLGTYKPKIEAVFTRLTLAYDVLTSKQRRAEYDEYLAQVHRNRAMAALIEQTPRDIATIQSAIESEGHETVAAPGRYASEPPPPPPRASIPPASLPSEPPGARPVESARRVEAEPMSHDDMRARREALARKLAGGTGRRPAAPPAPRPVVEEDPKAAARLAVESLRARYQPLLQDPRKVQLSRYLDQGRAALDRKDYAAAANAYRIAASLAPDDRHVQSTCEEAVRLADEALAEGYWKQAQYEEGQGAWADAAVSYARACAGRPDDAAAHERVAFATLKASANTRRAVEFARRAVELAPTHAEYRVTLARAYAAAGFEKSATGELDRALELAPKDGKIRELISQVRELAQKGAKVS